MLCSEDEDRQPAAFVSETIGREGEGVCWVGGGLGEDGGMVVKSNDCHT